MNNLGEVIKTTRKQRGLRQKDIAKAMSVSQSYICQVEKGKTEPTSMFIKLFCLKYLDDESAFLGGDEI